MKAVGERLDRTNVPDAHRWWSPYLVSGNVAVVRVDLTPNTVREENSLAWLDAVELERSARYLSEPRRRFILCRAALRALLCSELGCRNGQLSFQESDFGKPFALVDGQPVAIGFNLSHSGDHGLVAMGRGERLGIDVEAIVPRRHLESLIEAVMGPDERAELSHLSGQARLRQFFRLWTCKEALIKALGTGFSTNISGFQVPFNIRQGESIGAFRFPHLPAVTWRLEDISTEVFAAALVRELPSKGAKPSGISSQELQVSPKKVL